VEDKIVKFPDRDSHHVFVEPEGLDRDRWYPNGLSNSLPPEVQEELVHSIEGLEHAQIVQMGYGIEHDYLLPTQLAPTLETKQVKGLFFAGQINGTTGYEEAAAQGALAGINAGLAARGQDLVVLDRSQGYLGVLVDDLVTKGTAEPYRMFTSRVEYRLTIREDNADERLVLLAHSLGLVDDTVRARVEQKQQAVGRELERLRTVRVAATPGTNARLTGWGTVPLAGPATLEELLRRTEITYAELGQLDPASTAVDPAVRERAEIEVKYRGYIQRQTAMIERFKELEVIRIPPGFVYQGLSGLSREIVEKLTAIAPRTLGQAARVSGVTPAAISLLMIYLKKKKAK
jgi:tRNA uridine 5-carboxymethylaminomethyl modification enzyme